MILTMAEACRLANQFKGRNSAINQDENFCIFNVLCVFISLITILADVTTDILVFAEYCKDGFLYWALATLIFILTPNILINVFSMRWLIIDQKSNLKHWVLHGCLFGLLERYVLFLRKIFACQNFEAVKTQKLISQRNDLSLLHFLYIFTGTIPQIILQTYAIVILDENYYTKVFAIAASNTSVIWGCATYIYSIMVFSNENFRWVSLALRLVWHFSMLLARISGIFLSTIIFGIWTILPLGLHWTAMTFWIVIQNTTFCPNKIEETLYNVVMGFVYCFCYINLRDGHTRYRILLFYTLMVTQNFGSLFLYVLISDSERQKKWWSIGATFCIIVGTIIGMCTMIIYYRYFHSKGPITWKTAEIDVELNNKVDINKTEKNSKNFGLKHVRSFKSTQKENACDSKDSNEISKTPTQNASNSADKTFLLDHLIARSGTPTFTSAPVGNMSLEASSIEVYTVENTPQSLILPPKPPKKKTIFSPTELTIKLSALQHLESSIDKLTSKNLESQKRRGICFSDELGEPTFANLTLQHCNIINEAFSKTLKTDYSSEISHETDGSNKKTSSDSIDMDLDLSFSDINSSDINSFNENIVQKLCLSALKNIKVGNQDADIENIQRIALDILKEMYAKKDRHKSDIHASSLTKRDQDTPTEMLSVHDYENICAVNIAREAWGLRSWNGYCDIENWLHDGSVVRDRRRDTLTSASTEISSCISQDLKNAILTAPPFPRNPHTYSNVFIKFDKTNDDYVNTVSCQSNDETFLAKPCVIDSGKDPNQLEPIMEELDDLGDIDPTNKKRLNSESSLVATIDEIRKVTVTNSPRNLYHRTQVWDSPQFNPSPKVENNLKRALWKEPSKFNSSNIMKSLPEKENILNDHGSKYNSNKKELNFLAVSAPLHLDNTANVLSCSKNVRKRLKSSPSSAKMQMKKYNSYKTDHHLQDLSNKDIDFLWQLVSENSNSLPISSKEDLSSSRISLSMQSLIQKDTIEPVATTPVTKLTNVKKVSKSKPRRKFSILRERFEPKACLNSDEEVLYHGSDNTFRVSDPNFLNVINHFDMNGETEIDSRQPSEVKVSEELDIKKQYSALAIQDPSLSKNIKEKRSIFMKQVLSPPKFNTKLRYKV